MIAIISNNIITIIITVNTTIIQITIMKVGNH